MSFPLQVLLGLAVIGGLLYGIPYLLARLDRAWWLLPALFLAAPLAVVIMDMARGALKPTLFNGIFAYLGYVFRSGFMLTAVLGSVGISFLLQFVWVFAILVTIVDIVIRNMPDIQAPTNPILCGWVGIDAPYCLPTLGAYHIISAILAFVAIFYGNRLFDYTAGWLQQGQEWFARQIEE